MMEGTQSIQNRVHKLWFLYVIVVRPSNSYILSKCINVLQLKTLTLLPGFLPESECGGGERAKLTIKDHNMVQFSETTHFS